MNKARWLPTCIVGLSGGTLMNNSATGIAPIATGGFPIQILALLEMGLLGQSPSLEDLVAVGKDLAH